MVKFIADSACDLKEYPGICFETVPLSISTDEKNYTDDENLNVHEVLDYLEGYNDRSFTASPSPDTWMKAFEGADEIYCVTITSGLSGTYSGASLAREMYLEDHPDTKIYIVDSLSTGPGMVLILEKLAELKSQGKSFEEVCAAIERYRKRLKLYFSLSSLHNLAQNGRVSKLIASAIGFMNIKILGTASKEGTIEQVGKCRGNNRMIDKLIEQLKSCGFTKGKIRICHVECLEFANAVAEKIRSIFNNVDIKIIPARGLCSYYAERGGIILGCEC
ncbi:MAG: DegV family protein [Lachnospiraceae bacterium]|nr:DegV family protein [Lachnospiraceae bacterium]